MAEKSRLKSKLRSKPARVITVGGSGADIVAIRTKKLKLKPTAKTAIRKIGNFDWVFFTSKNTVRFFMMERVKWLSSVKVVAVGPETAKMLRLAKIKVSLVPKEFSTEGLIRDFTAKIKAEMKGIRILFPRSAIAPHDAPRALRAAGAKVTVIPLYTTIPVRIPRAIMEPIEKGEADCLVFMSPSGMRSFMKNVSNKNAQDVVQRVVRNIPVICIGPRTGEMARILGFKKINIAKTYSKAGISSLLRTLA